MNGLERGAQPATTLLVEDDLSVRAMLRRHLNRRGMFVDEASSEDEAFRRARERCPDVAVVDLGLAAGSGAELCSRMRADTATRDVPILVLTGTDDLETKMDLFRRGVDDYVIKPCAAEEVAARLDALLRRREGGPNLRHVGRLSVALRSGDAWLGETRLVLTAGERTVLSELARSWPVLARREALEGVRIRADRPVSTNVLEVLVGRLRSKLRLAGGGVAIKTVRGMGYVLEANDTTWEGHQA